MTASSDIEVRTKRCSRCDLVLPVTEFYKKKKNKDGINSNCKSCDAKYFKEWLAVNKDRAYEANAKYRMSHKEEKKASDAAYREINAKKISDRRKEWRRRNADRVNASNARRRAAKSNAAPIWLTETHLSQIQAWVFVAQTLTAKTGILYEVDHIHPINGENFCGLHVPWNLQVLTKSENSAKNNRPPADEADLFWG